MKLTRYKHDSAYSYALGATLVFELLKTRPDLIERVFIRPNIKHGEDLEKILSLLRDKHLAIIENTKAFNVLGAKENCLLAAEFKKPTCHLQFSAKNPHLVLVNPSDAGNLGTIMRSAVAFGYENLAIITPSVDPYDPKVIRASMGAIFHLNIQQFSSFADYHKNNTSRKYYAFMLDDTAQTLTESHKDDNNYALIFGNEAAGLPGEFANIAQPIYIPQSKKVDSLNLSVAAGIALYTFRIR